MSQEPEQPSDQPTSQDQLPNPESTESTERMIDEQEAAKTQSESERTTIAFAKKVFIIMSPSGGGKSHLTAHLYRMSGYSAANTIIISPTFEAQSDFFRNTFAGVRVVSRGFEEADYSQTRNSLLIFDDIGSSLLGNKSFESCLINKRHWNNTIFLLLQYFSFIPPMIRDNYEYVFCGRYTSLRAIKTLHTEFFSGQFESWKTLRKYISSIRGYTFILSDKTTVQKLTTTL